MYQAIGAVVGAGMGLAGSLLSAGKKPKIPDWQDVSLRDAQQSAISSNRNILPEAMDVASDVNTFNAQEIERLLRIANPQYDTVQNKFMSNMTDMMSGKLPSDVEAMIERKTAEKAVAGGFTGSGIGRNLTVRDLGLTSLQLTSEGMSSAERWLSQARDQARAPMMDVTSMFISPEMQFEANWRNAENRYNQKLMEAKIDSMPSPKKAAIGQWLQTTGSQLMGASLGAMSMGGGGAGASGGGGGTVYTMGDPMAGAMDSSYGGAIWQSRRRLY